MRNAIAVLIFVLVSCAAPAIAGTKVSDFPLRADVAASTKSESTKFVGVQLGQCDDSGYCYGGSDRYSTSSTWVNDATIDGTTYVISGDRLNPGVYGARWNGQTLELLGRGKSGKLEVHKMHVVAKV